VEIFSPEGQLRRRKELPRGGPPLLISEAAALIAQAGIQELSIEERRRALQPTADARPATPATPAPPAERAPASFVLRAGAFAQGRVFSGAHPVVFGFGAELSGGVSAGPWTPGALLLVAYQGPVSEETPLFSISQQAVQLRLLPSLRRSFGAFELELGLGGGLDLLIARTSAPTLPGRFVQANRLDPAPFVSAALSGRWQLTSATSLFVRATVDVDPARRRYVTQLGEVRESHLVPWLARPALQLGFSFELVGRPEGAP
jgi:hypothetical protein